LPAVLPGKPLAVPGGEGDLCVLLVRMAYDVLVDERRRRHHLVDAAIDPLGVVPGVLLGDPGVRLMRRPRLVVTRASERDTAVACQDGVECCAGEFCSAHDGKAPLVPGFLASH